MDLTAIREALAALAADVYETSTGFVPDDVVEYPAFIVGNPRSITYGESLGLASLEIPVTVAVSAGDLQDAQERINDALGTEAETSVPKLVNRATHSSWVQVNVTEADPARLVTVGTDKALAVDLIVTVRTKK